ncbi:Glycosyltransferase involved in cell wall bisynthesis [Abditibacterium utsteinense]|uniref:Glycosyltransferase involved in cell wall bisynthesis n=1 Tax=Abditibacterium utsteinense TaxID=1960156 RepID=A0A2S8SQK3_9BACT|nr:glycosyltransferase family 1 protein [Abditibacterium utsteinense]PQV63068.1 Glycosyltransferase involved in cell wall bisynthesis [Abditibacterium utsteinense]
MKIAFDATALYGRLGGIENALLQTFSRLCALDCHNQYLVFVPRDAPVQLWKSPFSQNPRWVFRRLPFDGKQKARRILWQQFELPSLLKREKCDLLHAWNYVAPLFSPLPTVLTVQDTIALDTPRFATRFNRLHYRAMMPRSLKRAAHIIVTTEKTKTQVLRRAPRAKVRVVPLGIDAIFFGTLSANALRQVAEKYALPPRFLLYVGNFEPKKNLTNLLRALQMLPGAPPLVIAGGIKPWPQFDRLLRGVRQLGFVPREDLPALYALCEAFCFPSLCEGFGLPVVEALACGAPVLTSTRVPLPNLESVAEMCQPRFPRSIARALEKTLSEDASSELEPQKMKARRDYAAQFGWDETARQTLAVYQEFS